MSFLIKISFLFTFLFGFSSALACNPEYQNDCGPAGKATLEFTQEQLNGACGDLYKGIQSRHERLLKLEKLQGQELEKASAEIKDLKWLITAGNRRLLGCEMHNLTAEIKEIGELEADGSAAAE